MTPAHPTLRTTRRPCPAARPASRPVAQSAPPPRRSTPPASQSSSAPPRAASAAVAPPRAAPWPPPRSPTRRRYPRRFLHSERRDRPRRSRRRACPAVAVRAWACQPAFA
eukprot:3130908-Prymnesium_polylepis.1